MSDLRTVSPDELPELSEIPDGLLAVVFSPAGPLQSVPYEKLLTKLIATDLAKADKAALDADLAHAVDSVALVHGDPTPALNGWYRKLGASGAGSWEQFEELSRNARVAADAAALAAAEDADRAEAAAIAAEEAGGAEALTIPRKAGPGSIAATNGGTALTATYVLPPFDADGFLDSVEVYCGTGGAGAITWKLFNCNAAGDVTSVEADLGSEVWAATGVQTKTFINRPIHKGQRIGFRRTGSTAGTFHFTSSAAAGIVDTAVADIAGAATLTKTGTSVPSYRLNYRAEMTDGQLVERVTALEALTGLTGEATRRLPMFRHGFDPTGTLAVKDTGYGPAKPFTRGGRLSRIRIDVTVAGLFQVIIAAPDNAAGTSWTPQHVFLINAAATGWQAFVGGTDFDAVLVQKGWRIFFNPSGGAFSSQGSLANAVYYTMSVPVRVGASQAITRVTGNLFGFDCEIEAASESLADMMESRGDRLRGSTVLETQLFPGTATPAGWTLNGWTINEGGLSPAAGAWTAYLGRASIPNATRRTARMKFTIETASTSIVTGIVFYGANSGAVVLDCASGAPMLQLFGSSTGGTPTWTKRAEVPVTFTVAPGTTTGRRYTLEIQRINSKIIATLWDTKSRESAVLTFDTKAYSAVLMKARVGVGPVLVAGSGSAGDVRVTQFDDVIDCRSDPHAIFIGDSIAEGGTGTDDAPGSWPMLIDQARGRGDILVCATGGDSTANVNYLATIFASFSPRYLVLQIGVNDISDATWRTNMTGLIAAIVAAGATPVLCTYTPRPDRPSNLKTADIRARYFGAYPFIDVAAAVSDDDASWLAGKALADLVHPAAQGSVDIAAMGMIEQPLLLDGARA